MPDDQAASLIKTLCADNLALRRRVGALELLMFGLARRAGISTSHLSGLAEAVGRAARSNDVLAEAKLVGNLIAGK
jgi:hypothetical protein